MLSFLFLSLAGLSHLRADPSQNLKLLSDSNNNELMFQITSTNEVMQIYESIKPMNSSRWSSPILISGSEVAVNSFDVKKDIQDNIVVVWMGENTELSIYSLYGRVYLSLDDIWLPIIQVSGNDQNLTGNYATIINNQSVGIIWTSYDENFSIQNHNLTINIGS